MVWNQRLKESLFNPAIQWMVGAWISLYALVIGLYGYNVQPVLDFRSYPVGVSLTGHNMDVDDETDYRFVYEKNGVRKEFGIDSLPDSTWTFVDRIEPETISEKSDNRLAIFDGEDDVTDDVLSGEGVELLLVIPEPVRADISYSYTINEMEEYADSVGIPMIGVLGAGGRRCGPLERCFDG